MNNQKSIFVALIVCLGCCANLSAQQDIKAFTEPYRSIEIAAPEMGTVARLAVKEGDQIQAGDILANLNDEVLAASLAVAKQSTESEGSIHSAMAELQMQNDRVEKLQGLFERRHASQTELDRAKSQLEIAAAKVEMVQDENRIKKLEMRRIQAQLDQRRLRTPIDGVVTQIHKDEGEFVSPSDPIVMTVVQLNPLRVIFSVPQSQTSRLKINQTVPVVVGNTEHQGLVEFVSPTADAQSGTCRVKIQLDNSDLRLASGQPCFLKGFASSRSNRVVQTSGLKSLSTIKPKSN